MTVTEDDPLYNLVAEDMRTKQTEVTANVDLVSVVQQDSQTDVLDLNSYLLVMGILELQLLELPVQPRRFADWTVAYRK